MSPDRADLQALDLIEAATRGHTHYADAWASIPGPRAAQVLQSLEARRFVDDLFHGTAVRVSDPPPGEVAARAARAAYQVAGSLVADSLERGEPQLVASRLDSARRSAHVAADVARYATQLVCEPEARLIATGILSAALEHRAEDARYLATTTAAELVEAVLHVAIDALGDLQLVVDQDVLARDDVLPDGLGVELGLVRADVWPARPDRRRRLEPTDVLRVADIFAHAARLSPRVAGAVLGRVRGSALGATG